MGRVAAFRDGEFARFIGHQVPGPLVIWLFQNGAHCKLRGICDEPRGCFTPEGRQHVFEGVKAVLFHLAPVETGLRVAQGGEGCCQVCKLVYTLVGLYWVNKGR